MRGKVGSQRGKDIAGALPNWKRASNTEVEVEWPAQQKWFEYFGMVPDNSMFDATGRIRKKCGTLPRLASSAASPRRLAAEAEDLSDEEQTPMPLTVR